MPAADGTLKLWNLAEPGHPVLPPRPRTWEWREPGVGGRLYHKLGASNRAQALMTALRHGLIGHGEDGRPASRTSRNRGRPGPAGRSVAPGPPVRCAR